MVVWSHAVSGIILCMGSAIERRRYKVTPSLIGRAHTQNDPWICIVCVHVPLVSVSQVRATTQGLLVGRSPMWGSLVHIMAFHLFSLQPLPEPILTCQFNPFKQTSVIVSSKCSKFHSTKCISKCLLQQLSHFVLSWLVLILPVNTVLTVWFTWWVGGLRVSALEPVVCHLSLLWFAIKMIWLDKDDYSCYIKSF